MGDVVFNSAIEILDEHILRQKLDTRFQKFKCAAKFNVAFGSVLKNVADGTCRYYSAHENNTSMERSKLEATKEGLVKITSVLSNSDVIEECTTNEKIQIRVPTNSKLSLLLLFYSEKIPWCKDAVLPKPSSINHTVNCLTDEENTRKPYNGNLCPFRALILHLHGNGRFEEENPKLFNLFREKMEDLIQRVSKVFVWRIFQLLMIWFKWTSSCRK